MTVLERVSEKKLRDRVNINELQMGFMPGKGTMDAIFLVRQLQEKFLEKKKNLYYAFVDLEKAFDRIPRELLRLALRKLMVEEWLVQAVMSMYKRARTVVRTKHGDSDKFEVTVGVHQGSVLSPFLFVIVMEALTREARTGLPWEILYADDLVLVAESMTELRQKVLRWKKCLETKGLKLNVKKTKVMVSGRNCGDVEKVGKWPCVVCGKGVATNSIQCMECEGWVHKRCSGVKLRLTSVAGMFRCSVCERRNAGDGRQLEDSLDLGNGDCLERVGKFCYLGDVLNGNGGSNSATVARIRSAWCKFRELCGFLTKKAVSMKLKGKVYAACVRSAMVYGSETWAMTVEQMMRLERAERRMLRWMCGVSLKDKVTTVKLREQMGVDAVSDVVRRGRLRWLGHVLRKDDGNWVKKVMSYEVDGDRGRGRPRLSWRQVVEKDMWRVGLKKSDAEDRALWRRQSWSATGQPLRQRGKRPLNGRK